jgi:ACS family hexuronate transporter-like MFS transporter
MSENRNQPENGTQHDSPFGAESAPKPVVRTWRIPYLRWWIIGVCFLGTMVNYIDRQALSVSAKEICNQFTFSNEDYSSIVNSFLLAYTIMQFVSGAIVDRIGVRWGMALFAVWWSVSGMLHALGNGLWSFRTYRFLLGMGEAGNWPAATKAVSEWFPARERALAVAIFDSGSGIGGMVAAPLVAWLILHYGWQMAFVATGALALIWVVLWLVMYHSPESHPRISSDEFNEILAARQREGTRPVSAGSRLALLARRSVWGIVLGRSLTDCVWWFYVYWLPKYLADQRDFSLAQIAALAWIPFLTADIGNVSGGWFSGHLMRRGWTINAARKGVLLLGVIGMLGGIPAGLTSNAYLCIALISVATMAYGAWGTIMLTLPADLFPPEQTGTVSGMSGTGAGLGGLLFTWVIGIVVDRVSYTPIFLAAGLMPLAALALVQVLIPSIRTVEQSSLPLGETDAGQA